MEFKPVDINFKYDPNVAYKSDDPDDSKDFVNYVGSRVRTLLELGEDLTEKELIELMYLSAKFRNEWEEKGADDIRMLAFVKGFVMTALKRHKVLVRVEYRLSTHKNNTVGKPLARKI